jgi:hypothetical protein
MNQTNVINQAKWKIVNQFFFFLKARKKFLFSLYTQNGTQNGKLATVMRASKLLSTPSKRK